VGNIFGLSKDGPLAAPAYGSAFMDGDRAEVALAIAAAVGGDGKADRLQRFDLALPLIIGMLSAFIVKLINTVEGVLRKIRIRRVVYEIAVAVKNQAYPCPKTCC